MATVRQVIEHLAGVFLDSHMEPVRGSGWPLSRSCPVGECLLCIHDEGWGHRFYAERDPGVLEVRRAGIW